MILEAMEKIMEVEWVVMDLEWKIMRMVMMSGVAVARLKM